MHSLNSILRKFTKDFDLAGGAKLTTIKNHWENIVGHTIAVHTSPYILRSGTLTLTVDTPQWMHHLSFFKEEIKDKLKKYNVQEIHFSLGKLPESPKCETKKTAIEISDSDTEDISEEIEDI